jgi:hypothetical protein
MKWEQVSRLLHLFWAYGRGSRSWNTPDTRGGLNRRRFAATLLSQGSARSTESVLWWCLQNIQPKKTGRPEPHGIRRHAEGSSYCRKCCKRIQKLTYSLSVVFNLLNLCFPPKSPYTQLRHTSRTGATSDVRHMRSTRDTITSVRVYSQKKLWRR